MKSRANHQTLGLLLAQAQQHQLLEPYACVIIDEAHERGANTDILMGILKVVTKKRKDLKVVIMSATLDIERFEAYFPLAPTLKCDGRSFPVDMNYLSREPETPAQLLSMAAKKVIDIHLFGRRGDILVFVSGAGEMQDVMRRIDEMLKDYDEGDLAPLEVHELTAKHSPDDQERASKGRPPLSKNSKPGRKVIVATNVAETSITFDGLVFVVDTGRAKSKVYNPRNQSTMFKEHSISKAQAAQRAGRVGRREPGTCYRLYTERTFLTMFEENSTPALLQGSVTAVTLKLLNMNQDPLSFDFMQAPAPESVMRALEELSYLGCLQSAAKLSPHGTQVARYAMEPALAKMLIESSFPAHGCSAEIVSIIAMLEVLEKQFKYWITPRAEEEYAAVARGKRDFSHWSGMHLQMLMIYYAWRVACEDGQSREFCTHYGLQYRFLTAVDTSRAQMRLYMEKNGAQLLSLDENDPDYTNKIRRALCIGHFMHAAKQTSMGYKSLRHGLSVQFDEKKLGGLKSDKEWVIYNEVQLRDDGFELDIVTSVKVDWLIEACPDYFDMETFPPGEVKDDLTKAIRSMTKVSKKAIAGRSPPT